ncbi:GntR family transcriptional regulator [Streptomyces thinghirensis]|nr:GntR family transcriptional regulator [Streptomyces thinghirensis]
MRQALKELEDEGLITRHRRRGTFIEPDALRAPRCGCWARSTRSWPSSPA